MVSVKHKKVLKFKPSRLFFVLAQILRYVFIEVKSPKYYKEEENEYPI